MSNTLAALDRFGEAAQAAAEALDLLAPFVARYPGSFGELARTIVGDVLRYSEQAGVTPAMELINRVNMALPEGSEATSR